MKAVFIFDIIFKNTIGPQTKHNMSVMKFLFLHNERLKQVEFYLDIL